MVALDGAFAEQGMLTVLRLAPAAHVRCPRYHGPVKFRRGTGRTRTIDCMTSSSPLAAAYLIDLTKSSSGIDPIDM
jgi:hypothetical protein